MENPEEVRYLKSKCPHCKGSIEFPKLALGETIDCPHCNKAFRLQLKDFPGLPVIFTLFISALYFVAFFVVLAVVGLFALCLSSGILAGFWAYTCTKDKNKAESGWIGVIVFIGVTIIAWLWLHGNHPAMPDNSQ